MKSQNVIRALSHSRHWVELRRKAVASAEESVARYLEARDHAVRVLGPLDTLSFEPAPLPDRLAPLARFHQRGTSSVVDFEPREIMCDVPVQADVVVEKIGAGDGDRVTTVWCDDLRKEKGPP